MKVLFFAGSRELTGVSEKVIIISQPLTLSGVWARLIVEYPPLEALKSSARLARNGAYAEEESQFENDDEVAVIPPVSGG